MQYIIAALFFIIPYVRKGILMLGLANFHKHIERKTRLAQQNDLSPICIISACQPFQRNFETKVGNSYYGTLSYSLYKVLKEVNQWNRTYYPKIWEQAKSFSSKQIPMIESSYAL